MLEQSSAFSPVPRWSPAQLRRGGRSPCRGLGGLPGPGTLAREPEVDPKTGLSPGLPGTTAEFCPSPFSRCGMPASSVSMWLLRDEARASDQGSRGGSWGWATPTAVNQRSPPASSPRQTGEAGRAASVLLRQEGEAASGEGERRGGKPGGLAIFGEGFWFIASSSRAQRGEGKEPSGLASARNRSSESRINTNRWAEAGHFS